MERISVETHRREQMVDVTAQVRAAVRASGVRDGICLVYSTHTTCGVTINENADPAVESDALQQLEELVPREGEFEHAEGNADSHIKTMLVGTSASLPVSDGEPVLGTWQGVFLCEFDGPRRRTLVVLVR